MDVFVEQNQWVDLGAKLLVLEAMKMQHVVTAAVAGTVTALQHKRDSRCRRGTCWRR